jgi:urease accessory protein
MIVAERIYRDSDVPDTACSYALDTVTLGWEDRTHAHGRRRTDSGIEFGISLPRGTTLRGGDRFVLDEPRIVVTVVERPEPVFVVRPRTPVEWALYAYQIGNRHQPLMITGDGLVCPDVPGVKQLLDQYHMPYVREMMPFTPAAVAAGHSH